MAIEHREVQFRLGDIGEVTSEMDGIVERANGREWLTFSPWVDAEHLPTVSVLRRLFTGRGPKVPAATWTPAVDREPAQLGFLHATGAHASERLQDADVEIPETWIKVSDHSKRGLLYAVHPDATHDQVVRFAVAASTVLAMVPTDDRWVAQASTLI